MKLIKKNKYCRFCHGRKFTLVHKYINVPIGEEFLKEKDLKNKVQDLYPLEFYRCNNCQLFQLLHVINAKTLYKNYLYQSKTSNYLKRHFFNYTKEVIRYCKIKKNNLILDIGSNDGTLLSFFQKKKYKVLGIEPAREVARIANKKKIKTINSFFSSKLTKKIINRYGHPKVICANNVFANIDNVENWMMQIHKLLDKNGFFIFESYYLLDLVKNKVFDFIYHEHLSAFSIKPIIYLSKKYNFKLVRLEKVNTKGGSLRYYLVKSENKLKEDYSVKTLYDEEINFGLYKKNVYNILFRQINYTKNKLLNFLNKKKNQNIKLIAFGASITCITLMHQFNLQNKILSLYDDNKIKDGMFSPYSHIPVYHSKKMTITKNNIILILAWRFQKEILKKYYTKFKKAKYIVQVMPKFKIIN
jgi:SAM-dependent methyltransferase